jgi:hypothetical protein
MVLTGADLRAALDASLEVKLVCCDEVRSRAEARLTACGGLCHQWT